MEPLTNSRQYRWGKVKNCFILIPAVLLILACGGPAKSTKVKGVYYQVKAGDTLTKIGKIYNVSPQALAEANNMPHPDQLLENTILFIPNAEPVPEKNGSAPSEPGKSEAPREKPAQNSPPAVVAPKKPGADKKGAGAVKSVQEPVAASDKAPAVKSEPVKDGPVPVPPAAGKKPVSKSPGAVKPSQKDEGATPAERPRPQDPAPKPQEADTAAVPAEDLASPEKGRFAWPVKGKVVNRFGLQPNGMYFNHIRIITRDNAPVAAAAQGTVIFSAPLKEFGETVHHQA